MNDEALFEWKLVSPDRPLSYGEKRNALRPKKHVMVLGRITDRFKFKSKASPKLIGSKYDV